MSTDNDKKLTPRFREEVRFEIKPVLGTPLDAEAMQELFSVLQERLEVEFTRESDNPRLHDAVELASNEAAAVAWTTQLPLLVMPELFREKVRTHLLWKQRQDWVQARADSLIETL